MTVRARVIPALVFAAIWVLGFEIVPVAHQAMHAQLGAHTHGAITHCHGAFCHSDEGAPKQSAPHGSGSLEHRGVAALAPELTIYVPERVLVGELPPDAVLAQRIETFERCAPPATGPPAA